MSRNRATTADVARAAGVSKATVSYVLNDVAHHSISARTRAAVMKAVRDLDYTPNRAARSLATGNTHLIVTVIPDNALRHLGLLIGGVLGAELSKFGIVSVIHQEGPGSRAVVDVIAELLPTVVFAMDELAPEVAAQLRMFGTETISLSGLASSDPTYQEPQSAAQMAHLIARGHREIAYALPDGIELDWLANPRMDTARRVARSAGIPDPPAQRIPQHESRIARIVESWHQAGITAVCCYNDEVAFRVLRGVSVAGLSCPADVAVIGVDDIPLAPFAHPPLTSVAVPEHTRVAILVNLIVAAARGLPIPDTSVPDDAVVVHRRQST
ncbi:LacI family DNA-binding transcriptional regulator [Mycolicibacterium sarraceniae]|uniref:LacI family transcriptional regulator n=1 Tax=Mycolicibacterium sarraceniae TaxID=1534348 RepID=A0A7I7SZI4_9MYCO|nr:LacI family DNA-binding transcriptional regulator [Mycolicibacterium sarraceniae]BBY61609.1 LacI family transcriptional regulator [Mycolicibacterium sarraceniae]